MEAYNEFASLYDIFMEDTPYEEWGNYAKKILYDNGIEDGLVLDLACGSGIMTEFFARRGYDMTGIDASASMLDEAVKKRDISGYDILYLCQDMREFELYGTVRAILCFCDSINYITEYKDLCRVFSLVNNYLDPGGVFIFDSNTVYKYKDVIGEATIAENREEGSFIWENFYDDETGINEYDLTLFVKEEDGRYKKTVETHYQRGYTPEDIKRAAVEAGLVFDDAVDAVTYGPPTAQSERIFYVLKESGKTACNPDADE